MLPQSTLTQEQKQKLRLQNHLFKICEFSFALNSLNEDCAKLESGKFFYFNFINKYEKVSAFSLALCSLVEAPAWPPSVFS